MLIGVMLDRDVRRQQFHRQVEAYGMHWIHRLHIAWLTLILGLIPLTAPGSMVQVTFAAGPARPAVGVATRVRSSLLVLGPGDEVNMRVFGQPDMNGSMYVSDHGTISVPLAGAVHVAGLSPSQAARRVEAALKTGQFMVNPQVTLTIVKSRSQQVSVLGQVHAPGIYPVDSNTTLLELLAQAGGETDMGSNTIDILRTDPGGRVRRLQVNLRGLANPATAPAAATITLRGGDQVYVPRAPMFYVTGQVHTPGGFRLRPDTTVLQAIARAGGITNTGSMGRIVITRREPGGKYRIIPAHKAQKVHANDVITVKERIF